MVLVAVPVVAVVLAVAVLLAAAVVLWLLAVVALLVVVAALLAAAVVVAVAGVVAGLLAVVVVAVLVRLLPRWWLLAALFLSFARGPPLPWRPCPSHPRRLRPGAPRSGWVLVVFPWRRRWCWCWRWCCGPISSSGAEVIARRVFVFLSCRCRDGLSAVSRGVCWFVQASSPGRWWRPGGPSQLATALATRFLFHSSLC